MLLGSQTIYSKNDDKSINYHKVIDAVFLHFGPGDETEELENKVRDEKTGTVSVVKYVVPKTSEVVDGKQRDVVSKQDPNDLFSAAVDYFQSTYPNKNPILVLLERATGGENLVIKDKNRPVKAMDESAAVEKIAKDLQKAMPALSLEMATMLAKEMIEKGKQAKAA